MKWLNTGLQKQKVSKLDPTCQSCKIVNESSEHIFRCKHNYPRNASQFLSQKLQGIHTSPPIAKAIISLITFNPHCPKNHQIKDTIKEQNELGPSSICNGFLHKNWQILQKQACNLTTSQAYNPSWPNQTIRIILAWSKAIWATRNSYIHCESPTNANNISITNQKIIQIFRSPPNLMPYDNKILQTSCQTILDLDRNQKTKWLQSVHIASLNTDYNRCLYTKTQPVITRWFQPK